MTHLQSCCFANLNLLLFCRSCCLRHRPLGSLSNDVDWYENVTQKVNSRCFKFYRAYSISFNLSNGGHFFLELDTKRFYQSCGKQKESSCLILTSSTKRKISHFHVVVVYQQQRNVRAMHVQSCCFVNLRPIAFPPFSLLSSSFLKLLNS